MSDWYYTDVTMLVSISAIVCNQYTSSIGRYCAICTKDLKHLVKSDVMSSTVVSGRSLTLKSRQWSRSLGKICHFKRPTMSHELYCPQTKFNSLKCSHRNSEIHLYLAFFHIQFFILFCFKQ